MFAVDSIPAIYSLTEEPYLVFAANAFSLLGLRQLYFLIDGLLDRLIFLHYGLAAILGFIGFKLVNHALHTNEVAFINGGHPVERLPEPSIGVSFAFILTVLLITIIASLTESARRVKIQSTPSARRANTQSTPSARRANIQSTPIAEDTPVPATSLDPLATGVHH